MRLLISLASPLSSILAVDMALVSIHLQDSADHPSLLQLRPSCLEIRGEGRLASIHMSAAFAGWAPRPETPYGKSQHKRERDAGHGARHTPRVARPQLPRRQRPGPYDGGPDGVPKGCHATHGRQTTAWGGRPGGRTPPAAAGNNDRSAGASISPDNNDISGDSPRRGAVSPRRPEHISWRGTPISGNAGNSQRKTGPS